MAAHIFCPQCGSKNDFANGRRPNFCSGCGYNFASLAAFGGAQEKPASAPARSRSNAALDIDVEGQDEQQGREDAGFSKDDVVISTANVKTVYGGGNTTRVVDTSTPTLGSFFAHPVQPIHAPRGQELGIKGKRVNKKAALETFKSEAKGSSEMKDVIRDPKE